MNECTVQTRFLFRAVLLRSKREKLSRKRDVRRSDRNGVLAPRMA